MTKRTIAQIEDAIHDAKIEIARLENEAEEWQDRVDEAEIALDDTIRELEGWENELGDLEEELAALTEKEEA